LKNGRQNSFFVNYLGYGAIISKRITFLSSESSSCRSSVFNW